jgi:hypothetical protein
MNKKSIVIFFSVLFLLSLGVYYVMAALSVPTNIIKTGSVSDAITAVPETINLTVITDTGNIWNVTFDLGGASTYYNWYFVGANGSAINAEYGTEGTVNQDYTYINGLNVGHGWNCSNMSYTTIDCVNTTAVDVLGATNTTLMVTINVTGVASTEASNTITSYGMDTTASIVSVTDTLISDNLVPRLINLNVSDGSLTVINGSLNGVPVLTTYGSTGLTVNALIADLDMETPVVLAYSCQGENVAIFDSTNQTSIITSTAVGDSLTRYVTGTIPYTCFDQTAGTVSNISFGLLANDTLNNVVSLNETAVAAIQLFTVSGMYDLARVVKVNATQTTVSGLDGVTTVSKTLSSDSSGLDGSSDYLAPNTVTFDIEVAGETDNVLLLWNDTGAATTNLVPVYGTSWTITNLDATAGKNATGVAGTGTSVFTTTLNLAGNDSNNFAFRVYMNNSGANYTAIGGPYRFTVDGAGATVTMTPPTDLVISPRASITYSCTMSDGASGTNKIMWQLKKPGDADFITKQNYEDVLSGLDSVTFTGDDTNLAGDYEVKCIAIDLVGNEQTYTTSSSELFSVHYSTSEGGASSGAGGAADIDLSTSEEITITEKQGVISTFTLDGTTVHTIKIKTVDEIAGTVTIVIESDPIEITLKIGETKEVDIDADGTNDISVMLNSIVKGQAGITTKRLTPLPEKEVPTEEVPTEKPAEEIPTVPEVASKTWLWILIIVIVVVIGVGYWFMKRK